MKRIFGHVFGETFQFRFPGTTQRGFGFFNTLRGFGAFGQFSMLGNLIRPIGLYLLSEQLKPWMKHRVYKWIQMGWVSLVVGIEHFMVLIMGHH